MSERPSSKISLSHPSIEWNKCYFKKAIKSINPTVDRQTACLQKGSPVQSYQLKLSMINGTFKSLTVSAINIAATFLIAIFL